MKKLFNKLPEGVQRFLLSRLLLGLLVWVLAIVVAFVGCTVAALAMIVAIFDPLRAADMIQRFGEEVAQ